MKQICQFLSTGGSWGRRSNASLRTWVKLAGALTIEMVPPCFSIRACPNPRGRPRVLGILIIIHGMLFSVAMVLCILISVSTYFTCAPENIIERNKHPKPEMHRIEWMNVKDSSWEFLACVLTIGCCCLSQAPPLQLPLPVQSLSLPRAAWRPSRTLVAYVVPVPSLSETPQQGATASFLFPFFGNLFQSPPPQPTCVASVFVVGLCNPSLLPSPPPQSAALFACSLQSPIQFFPTGLCGLASLSSPSWNLFITLP